LPGKTKVGRKKKKGWRKRGSPHGLGEGCLKKKKNRNKVVVRQPEKTSSKKRPSCEKIRGRSLDYFNRGEVDRPSQ